MKYALFTACIDLFLTLDSLPLYLCTCWFLDLCSSIILSEKPPFSPPGCLGLLYPLKEPYSFP